MPFLPFLNDRGASHSGHLLVVLVNFGVTISVKSHSGKLLHPRKVFPFRPLISDNLASHFGHLRLVTGCSDALAFTLLGIYTFLGAAFLGAAGLIIL